MAPLGAPGAHRYLPLVPSCREGPLPARSKLDELLGRGPAAKLLARPGTSEHREFKLDKKYQRPQGEEACGVGAEGQNRFLPGAIIKNKLYLMTHTQCIIHIYELGQKCQKITVTVFKSLLFFFVYMLFDSEKAMATHSSTRAWKIPRTEEPGRLQSMGSLRVGHN